MNVEIGTKAAQFPEKEYINGIFLAVRSSACEYQLQGGCGWIYVRVGVQLCNVIASLLCVYITIKNGVFISWPPIKETRSRDRI
jgi:hypothetical protein